MNIQKEVILENLPLLEPKDYQMIGHEETDFIVTEIVNGARVEDLIKADESNDDFKIDWHEAVSILIYASKFIYTCIQIYLVVRKTSSDKEKQIEHVTRELSKDKETKKEYLETVRKIIEDFEKREKNN